MSKENVQKFYDFVKGNEGFANEVLGAPSIDGIVELAKRKGFEFTRADYEEFVAEMEASTEKELSDDELDEAVGGFGFHIPGMDQIRVWCEQCSWDSGWQDIIAYSTYGALFATHRIISGHTRYSGDHRKH